VSTTENPDSTVWSHCYVTIIAVWVLVIPRNAELIDSVPSKFIDLIKPIIHNYKYNYKDCSLHLSDISNLGKCK